MKRLYKSNYNKFFAGV